MRDTDSYGNGDADSSAAHTDPHAPDADTAAGPSNPDTGSDADSNTIAADPDAGSTDADVIAPDANTDAIAANTDAISTDSDAYSIVTHTDTIAADTDTVITHSDTIAADADTVIIHSDAIAADTDTVITHSDTVVADTDTVITHFDTIAADAYADRDSDPECNSVADTNSRAWRSQRRYQQFLRLHPAARLPHDQRHPGESDIRRRVLDRSDAGTQAHPGRPAARAKRAEPGMLRRAGFRNHSDR